MGNQQTGTGREIRPPYGMKAPAAPLLPAGATIIIKVPAGGPGSVIKVNDPSNPGSTIDVAVPAKAKVGQKMAIPIPAKGESIKDVQARQEKLKSEWTTGGKMAVAGVAVGAVAG